MDTLFANRPDYPVITDEKDFLEALLAPDVRGVTLRDPNFVFYPGWVQTYDNSDVGAKYWHDEEMAAREVPPGKRKRERRSAGDIRYLNYVSSENVLAETSAAGIILQPNAVKAITERCNHYRDLFLKVLHQYIERKQLPCGPIPAAGYILATPIGGLGRSPELHVDNTILSLHATFALSSLGIYLSEPEEEIWHLLDAQYQRGLTQEDYTEVFNRLVQEANNPDRDLQLTQICDAIITKGQMGVDMRDKEARKGVCPHFSSWEMIGSGQLGYLMTPIMPSTRRPS